MAYSHPHFRPMFGPEGKGGGGAPEESVTGGTLILTLDDVLSRVPTRSLQPGLHDPARELHFAMEELLDGISRGRATIMLSKLAERYPDTFQAPAPGTEDSPIYLPLQKLIQQIGRATRRAPEKLVLPVVEPAPAANEPAAAEAPVIKPLRKLVVMQDPVAELPPKPEEKKEPGVPAAAPLPKFEPLVPSPKAAGPAASIESIGSLLRREPVVAEPPKTAPIVEEKKAEPPLVVEAKTPEPARVELRKVEPFFAEPPTPEARKEEPAPIEPPKAEVKAPEPVPVEAKKEEPPIVEPPKPEAKKEEPPPSEAANAEPPAKVEPPLPEPPKAEPPKPEPPKAEEKPPLAPPPLPVFPPAETKSSVPEPPPLFHSAPEVKSAAPAAPAKAPEPAPDVPHSPVLENPPANLESAARVPGRPIVRPPFLQGPAGPISTAAAAPPASPAMPGFVFAPRQSAPLSDFTQPVFPPEADLPGVHIPPLFPVHAGPPEAKAPQPAPVAPPAAAEPASIAELPQSPEPEPPPAAEPEQTPVTQPESVASEAAAVPPVAAPAPPPEPEPAAETLSVETQPTTVEPAPAAEEKPAEPLPAGDSVEAEEEKAKRQISHPRNEAAARAHELLGTHFSLARIDQEPLQAIFMTEEFLDLPRVSQLSCSFPGITGCMIVAGDALSHSGERPAGLDAQALCQLTKQLSAVAVAFPDELPTVQTYTLHIGNRALSIFARPHVSLCLVHSHRGFLPGVRERLAAVADTLSRGMSAETQQG